MTEDRLILRYPKTQAAAKVEVAAADAIAVEEEAIEMIVATAAEEKEVSKSAVAVLKVAATSQNSKVKAEGVRLVQTQKAQEEDAEEKDNSE